VLVRKRLDETGLGGEYAVDLMAVREALGLDN
jgi:hypothetical protein